MDIDIKLIYAAYDLDTREAIRKGEKDASDLAIEETIIHGFEFTDERHRD